MKENESFMLIAEAELNASRQETVHHVAIKTIG